MLGSASGSTLRAYEVVLKNAKPLSKPYSQLRDEAYIDLRI